MPRFISAEIDDTTYENIMAIRVHTGLRLPQVLALLAQGHVSSHDIPPLEGGQRDRLRPRGALTPEEVAKLQAEQRDAERMWEDLHAMCAEDDENGDES